MKKFNIPLLLLFSVFSYALQAQHSTVTIEHYLNQNLGALDQLYQQLHLQPELSLKEKNTAKIMAMELKRMGFSVTENFGAYGVVGVFKNGKGPTVLIRTDMDALPLEEKTGLSYASKAKGINAAGNAVSVMHACGHDMHMTVFVGTAQVLMHTKSEWSGTLIMVAQSAEENGLGADLMLKAGLYDRFPTPDYALALHVNSFLPAGSIGYREGALMASVDMMDITVFGKGGHGAAPHTTVDPIVLSAQMINTIQTIVSREINPTEPAVITVGSIHGGTVHNIIPDQVKMQLTLRSYSDEVRNQSIAAVKRICTGLAQTAGLSEDKWPIYSIREPMTPATVNDATLSRKLIPVLKANFGEEMVHEMQPYMVGEDFSMFGRQPKKVPIFMFWLGAVDPIKAQQAEEDGLMLPSLHSPYFAPLPKPTISTGVEAMSALVLSLMPKE